jgi:HlyD family secretion protein
MMKGSGKLVAGVVVLALVSSAVLYFSMPYLLGLVVQPIFVKRSEIVQTIVASGRVESPSHVDLGSQITGTVASVFVSEGDRVHTGDRLIALNDLDLKAAVDQAQATAREAEAKLASLANFTLPSAQQALVQARATQLNAQLQLDRMLQLSRRNIASRSALEEAQRVHDIADTQVRSAELLVESVMPGGSNAMMASAALEQARAALRAAEARIQFTQIIAPTDGVVIVRNVEPGMVVQPGKSLILLALKGEKRLLVQVDERNLSLIHLGQPALASADAYPAERFKAVLSFINPSIDAQRGSVEVKLLVPRPPVYLKEDMTVSVDIEVARRKDALVLPLDAVRDGASANPHVLLVVDGRIQEQSVKLGAHGQVSVEILSGVNEGDQVISATDTAITTGQRVRVHTPGSKS